MTSIVASPIVSSPASLGGGSAGRASATPTSTTVVTTTSPRPRSTALPIASSIVWPVMLVTCASPSVSSIVPCPLPFAVMWIVPFESFTSPMSSPKLPVPVRSIAPSSTAIWCLSGLPPNRRIVCGCIESCAPAASSSEAPPSAVRAASPKKNFDPIAACPHSPVPCCRSTGPAALVSSAIAAGFLPQPHDTAATSDNSDRPLRTGLPMQLDVLDRDTVRVDRDIEHLLREPR